MSGGTITCQIVAQTVSLRGGKVTVCSTYSRQPAADKIGPPTQELGHGHGPFAL
jgi:hypothetical protein